MLHYPLGTGVLPALPALPVQQGVPAALLSCCLLSTGVLSVCPRWCVLLPAVPRGPRIGVLLLLCAMGVRSSSRHCCCWGGSGVQTYGLGGMGVMDATVSVLYLVTRPSSGSNA